jgi:hypothetical protein
MWNVFMISSLLKGARTTVVVIAVSSIDIEKTNAVVTGASFHWCARFICTLPNKRAAGA